MLADGSVDHPEQQEHCFHLWWISSPGCNVKLKSLCVVTVGNDLSTVNGFSEFTGLQFTPYDQKYVDTLPMTDENSIYSSTMRWDLPPFKEKSIHIYWIIIGACEEDAVTHRGTPAAMGTSACALYGIARNGEKKNVERA